VSAANAADTDGPELPEVIVGGVGVGGGVGGAGVAVAGAGVLSAYQQLLSAPGAGSPNTSLVQLTALVWTRVTYAASVPYLTVRVPDKAHVRYSDEQ